MSIVLSCRKSKLFGVCVSENSARIEWHRRQTDNDNDRDESGNDDTDNRNGSPRNKHIFGTLAMTMNDTKLPKRTSSHRINGMGK